MKTPHKHAELIKAWADGAEIEVKGEYTDKWYPVGRSPGWHEDLTYRIKPEPKPDMVAYVHISELYLTYPAGTNSNGFHNLGCLQLTKIKELVDNVKLTFDGETGKLKAAEILE